MKKYHVFKININVLNIVSIIILLLMIIITYLISPNNLINMFNLFSNIKLSLLLIPIIIFYFILHELLHAIGYTIHGADYKKITFGMELEKNVFYCLCKQDISKKTVLYSLMYPLFFIGIVTYVLSIIFDLPILLLLSIANISGAAGDIMYFIFISKLDNKIMFSELDDGTSFAILTEDNPNKYKHLGLQYLGTKEEISRNDFKRIKISKLSLLVLIVCVILIVLSFLI